MIKRQHTSFKNPVITKLGWEVIKFNIAKTIENIAIWELNNNPHPFKKLSEMMKNAGVDFTKFKYMQYKEIFGITLDADRYWKEVNYLSSTGIPYEYLAYVKIICSGFFIDYKKYILLLTSSNNNNIEVYNTNLNSKISIKRRYNLHHGSSLSEYENKLCVYLHNNRNYQIENHDLISIGILI